MESIGERTSMTVDILEVAQFVGLGELDKLVTKRFAVLVGIAILKVIRKDF